MAIKKGEIKQIVKFYKEYGYANIFISGEIGSGKTTFGTQLIDLICKELNIKKDIKMIYFNMADFIRDNKVIKYLDADLDTFAFLNHLSFIQENLTKNINIFNTTRQVNAIEEFALSHFIFKIPFIEDRGIRKRGRYEFEKKIGKFNNTSPFNMKDLYEMKKKEFVNNSIYDNLEYRDYSKRIRAERHLRVMVLPALNNQDFHNALLEGRLQFIFNSKEGRGKTTLAKELHKLIDKKYKPINLKKVWELIGLMFLYDILVGLLLIVVGFFGFHLWLFTYTICVLILSSVFMMPILKELKLIN